MGEQLTLRGELRGHAGWVTSIATTEMDPNTILSASRDKSVMVWDLSEKKELGEETAYGVPKRQLTGHSHFVQDVIISSDGQFALSGSWDGTLRLWDIAKVRLPRVNQPATAHRTVCVACVRRTLPCNPLLPRRALRSHPVRCAPHACTTRVCLRPVVCLWRGLCPAITARPSRDACRLDFVVASRRISAHDSM